MALLAVAAWRRACALARGGGGGAAGKPGDGAQAAAARLRGAGAATYRELWVPLPPLLREPEHAATGASAACAAAAADMADGGLHSALAGAEGRLRVRLVDLRAVRPEEADTLLEGMAAEARKPAVGSRAEPRQARTRDEPVDDAPVEAQQPAACRGAQGVARDAGGWLGAGRVGGQDALQVPPPAGYDCQPRAAVAVVGLDTEWRPETSRGQRHR
jgi:hypothetical protein